MRKILCISLSFLFVFVLFPIQSFAEKNNDLKDLLTAEFVENSIISYEECENGEYIIRLIHDDKYQGDYGNKRQIELYYDSKPAYNYAVNNLTDIKEKSIERGSGTHSESNWFYGYSLYISSSVHYLTTVSSNITFGKVTSVDVSCQTNSGTVIDNISISAGEVGFLMNGGYHSYTKDYNNIANNSTTNLPTTWPYVLWDSYNGTSAGASSTVTIHRGTASQRSYTLYNNVIG